MTSRAPKASLTAADALALLTGGGVGPSSAAVTDNDAGPTRAWSLPALPVCDDCGERDRLWVYRRPTDGKYGEYCERCTTRYSEATVASDEKRKAS